MKRQRLAAEQARLEKERRQADAEKARLEQAERERKAAGEKARQELLTLRGHTGDVAGVAYSPDGKRLATASCPVGPSARENS